MTTFWETVNRNLSGWVLPKLLTLSGFALIGHVFIVSSSISVINSIMVLVGTALVLTAMLLLPASANERESTSGQILSFDRRDSDSSQDASKESERRAA